MKILTLNRFGKHSIILRVDKYANNGNLAIQMLEVTDSCYEPWSTLTVNLGKKCAPDRAFIDTNNNGDEIIEWLIENELGKLTGRYEISGWCEYPEFEFDMEKLREYALEE